MKSNMYHFMYVDEIKIKIGYITRVALYISVLENKNKY